jgi:nucleoside-diphosphate-sugar epimerase
MKVFITGGTGFIGSRLVEKLIAGNHDIILLVRDPLKLSSAEKERATIVKGDILDPESLIRGMTGCDRVFHLASYTKQVAKDPAMPYKINMEGTRNVLESAMECGIKRVIVTSTCGTLGFSEDDRLLTENSFAGAGSGTVYDRTKAEAEKTVLEYCIKGLYVVIVNPSRVYGPGKLTESNSLTKIIRWYINGKWRILPGSGKAKGNYVFIEDVVNGMISAADRGAKGERYILGGENLSLLELFDTIGESAGKRRRLIRLPAGILKMAVSTMQFISGLTGVPQAITREWLDKYLRDAVISSDKAKRELNYSITPFRKGAEMTIRWLRSES